LLALKLTLVVPLGCEPVDVGVNVNANVHEEPGAPARASGVPVEQVLDESIANWESPVSAMVENETVCVVWLLVTVIVLMALVWFSAELPKGIVVVEKLTGVVPFPVTGTLCGLLLAFVVIITDPTGAGPTAVGVKVTPTLHVVCAANEPGFGQLVEGSMAKPPAGATIELIDKELDCSLLRVNTLIKLA
jgi:hypothetical protein